MTGSDIFSLSVGAGLLLAVGAMLVTAPLQMLSRVVRSIEKE